MRALAIELNDAAIRVAGPTGVVATEPGCALVADRIVAVGREAFAAARLRPHEASDRFWVDLGLERPAHADAPGRSHADVAFAQLSSLWSRFGKDVADVALIVPAAFTRQQLRFLLGISDACGMPVTGMVDAAVAGSTGRAGVATELLHLELCLHQAVVTRLDQAQGISRAEYEVLSGIGLATLRERWVRATARAFLLQARFDPLHHAEAEQALYDQLPVILRTAGERGVARIELSVGGRSHAAEVHDVDLVPPEEMLEVLVRGVRRLQQGASDCLVQIGPLAGEIPGLSAALERAPGLRTCTLSDDTACRGALAYLAGGRRSDGRVKLITRLHPSEGSPAKTEDPGHPAGEIPEAAPSHVVVRGRVHEIPQGPFLIGTHPAEMEAGVLLSSHDVGGEASCTLRRTRDGVVLERFDGTVSLNGRQATERVALQIGDTVRMGTPGINIQLVALAATDAT